MDSEDLFETREEAEFALRYKRVPRTEYLDLPTWEEFCEYKYYSFNDEFCNHYELELSKYSTISIMKYPCDFCVWEKPLIKENYLEACEICRKLWLGE